jgi:hypothetical protein
LGGAQGKATCAKRTGHERMGSMHAEMVQQRDVGFATVAQCGLLQASIRTVVQKQADEGTPAEIRRKVFFRRPVCRAFPGNLRGAPAPS